ncbi:Aste57867_14980 [Aphanomyces stellatus]|uniref:Aste57867_14980 protein n=1 Tax=Aphanomyces stellatus TaxID=120398 RepID=A0A485L231_9STRA|nr:hypothetical protein As57867_014924 [Aphanomyces stellatus]VFT91794.1 Aste57867_14980 [Aphanomyces stellatus]
MNAAEEDPAALQRAHDATIAAATMHSRHVAHHHHSKHHDSSDAHMIHKILSKRPEVRSMEEVDTLFEWVLKNGSTNKLFSGIQDVICKTICREMTLYTAPPNTVVCYQGDFGDVFYIIIAGQVALYVEEMDKKKPFEDDLKRLMAKALADQANGGGVDDASRPKQFGKFIRFIGAGGTFGELAVMEPTAQRTCTVLTTMMTSFICLKRAAYQRLVRASNGDQVGFTQFEFLEDLFFFDEWTHGDVQRLSNKLRQVSVTADSFLLRHGNEANVMYFIYSGVVQESLPMLCLMDENGVAIKYTPVEEKKGRVHGTNGPSASTMGSNMALPGGEAGLVGGVPLSELKRKRISVEIALYEEHDVCGEHAIVYNQSHSKVDLRAVTDVKALVMDRAVWVDLFLVDRLESVVKALTLFRQLAQARDHWRDTRAAIAVSHPRLLLTISTRAMMRHAHILCGWCGSCDHNTGDVRCAKVIVAKQKAEIRKKRKLLTEQQKQLAAKERRRVLRGASSKKVLDSPEKTLKMRFRIAARAIVSTVQINQATATLLSPREQILKDWTVAANNQARICAAKDDTLVPKLQVPDAVRDKAIARLPTKPRSPLLRTKHIRASYVPEFDDATPVVPPPIAPLPLAMQNPLARGNLTLDYRKHLLAKMKKVQSVEGYHDTRTAVLDAMVSPEDDPAALHPPRRPKVPKNRPRRKGPQSTRVYRRVDRMLKKLWPAEYALPQIEESLKDIQIRSS